jgi:two-component system, LytTR family, response regulator
MSYSVVLIDDEPPARAKLQRFIAELPDFRVVASAGTVAEGIETARAATPDVLFLDIQLGNHSGFDILDALGGTPAPLVIFTTAYSEYAVKAFELQALDYLLKPFDRDRFTRSIERTRQALREPDRSDVEERVRRLLAQIPGRPASAQQILIKGTEKAFFLSVDDIQRVCAAGNYVEVHARGKVHLVRDTLTTFIAQLDPSEFLRVHRSHVVRINFISELRPLFHGDYELVLKDGQTLSLSRRYKALLPPAIRERL